MSPWAQLLETILKFFAAFLAGIYKAKSAQAEGTSDALKDQAEIAVRLPDSPHDVIDAMRKGKM